MLALKTPSVRASRSAAASSPRPALRPVVVMRAGGAPPAKKNLDALVQDALHNAEEECGSKGVNSKDCEVAWDQAEELLAAKSHKKVAEDSDPLEKYCKDEPDADECRVYDN